MRRAFVLLVSSLCGSVIVVGIGVFNSSLLSFDDLRRTAASVFFTDSITESDLKAHYAEARRGGEKIRILIVPGHDDESWGAEFRGVREADMNAAVGEELSRLLSRDAAYEPVLVRTKDGYAKEFRDYFVKEKDAVRAFLSEKKNTMRMLQDTGVTYWAEGVLHNSVQSSVALKLYALNKWANEHEIDIAIHIHFNDYFGRPRNKAGRYAGYALYVPETQYSNAKASRAVAEALTGQFSQFYSGSDLPVEDSVIILDQELIAVGAYNTLDPVSVFIEYGYIYEHRFLDAEIRERLMRELAFQTYLGLNRFFGTFEENFRRYPTTLLPHAFGETLSEGLRHHPSVLSLQMALLLDGIYPPDGDLRACPLSGSFGPCTRRAVIAFQEKYNIAPAIGVVGAQTLAKLNELYGR